MVLCAAACGDDSPDHSAGKTDAQTPVQTAGTGGSAGTSSAGPDGGTSTGAGFGGFGDITMTPNPCAPGEPCSCIPCGAFGQCKDCGGGCDCSDVADVGQPALNPVPLPWTPPFKDVGADGWRDSSTSLCTQLQGVFSMDVWSDDRGVFLLASGVGVNPLLTGMADEDAGVPFGSGFGLDPGAPLPRTQLWRNDGSGWTLQLDQFLQFASFELSGAKDGPLFLHERPLPAQLQQELMAGGGIVPASQKRCSLGVINGKKIACEDLGVVDGLHVAAPDLTFAVVGKTRLLIHDGTSWHAHPSLIPYPATAVWGDGSKLIVVGEVGTVFWQEQDGWELQDAGIVDHFSQLWGTAADDLWAGTAHGQILHYDGEQWTRIGKLGGVTCDAQLPITGIWGTGDQVYFHTDAQLARWNGSELETLGNWSCTGGNVSTVRIGGMWGNGPNELFIAMLDQLRFEAGGCGASYVVYYDGKQFHRM